MDQGTQAIVLLGFLIFGLPAALIAYSLILLAAKACGLVDDAEDVELETDIELPKGDNDNAPKRPTSK